MAGCVLISFSADSCNSVGSTSDDLWELDFGDNHRKPLNEEVRCVLQIPVSQNDLLMGNSCFYLIHVS